MLVSLRRWDIVMFSCVELLIACKSWVGRLLASYMPSGETIQHTFNGNCPTAMKSPIEKPKLIIVRRIRALDRKSRWKLCIYIQQIGARGCRPSPDAVEILGSVLQ